MKQINAQRKNNETTKIGDMLQFTVVVADSLKAIVPEQIPAAELAKV